MSQVSSKLTPLDIGNLDFHKSHPDTFTLFKLDASRLRFSESNPWELHPDLKDIGKYFLKKSLPSKKNLIICKSSEKKKPSQQERAQRLEWSKKSMKTSEGERTYYVISVYHKRMSQKSINLINSLNAEEDDDDDDDAESFQTKSDESDSENLRKSEKLEGNAPSGFALLASLILFPTIKKKTTSMAYGFGKWNMLIDPCCIQPKWGLKLLCSSTIFQPNSVKDVKSTFYRTSNTSTQTARVQKPTRIENFGLEVSSQGLDNVRACFNQAYNLKHLVKGDHYLQFSIKSKRMKENETHMTIKSLEQIAKHFHALTDSEEFTIHERMQELIDQEVRDPVTINELYDFLNKSFNLDESKGILFVDESLWTEIQGCYFGSTKNKSPLKALLLKQNQVEKTPLSEMKIEVFDKKRDKDYTEEFVLYFLSSNPIEYKTNFFRLERGQWFVINDSRFESIKKLLRQRTISAELLGLPEYNIQDLKLANTVNYKESIYNEKAAKALSKSALLLDRSNISLGQGSSEKFEFGDILLIKDEIIYIIHIKRASVKEVSHLREQVERTGDYLATEFKKSTATDFLSKIIINNLIKNEAKKPNISEEKEKEKVKGKGKEKGKAKKKKKENFFQSCKLQEEELDIFSKISTLTKDMELKNFIDELKQIFPKKDYYLLNTHRAKFMLFFDCLFESYETQKKKIKTIVLEFIEYLKQFVDSQEILFRNGPFKKEDLQKIAIVLAVIDDRKVEKAYDTEKKDAKNTKKDEFEASSSNARDKKKLDSRKEKQTPLFNKQDLWGLDRTRLAIEKQGFGFHVSIINHDKTEDFDAFGEVFRLKATSYCQKEDDHKGSKTIETEQKHERTKEDQNDAESSADSFLSSNKNKTILKNVFKSEAVDQIDSLEIQKVAYRGETNSEEGLYSDYITCPTKGDGDCFFHAVFTAPEEETKSVQKQAANMREGLVEAIKAGKYSNDIKDLLYENYLNMYSQGGKGLIPASVCQKFDENSHFQRVRGCLLQYQSTLQKHLTQNLTATLDQEFSKEFLYSEEQIKAGISQAEINEYMERFQIAGGENSYIPVRKDMKCPAEIIALNNDKNINIFSFNESTKSLDLYKSIRSSKQGEITNILIEAGHFIRLLGRDDTQARILQSIQIIQNSEIKEFERIVWDEVKTPERNYNDMLMENIDEDPSILVEGESLQRKRRKLD